MDEARRGECTVNEGKITVIFKGIQHLLHGYGLIILYASRPRHHLERLTADTDGIRKLN